MLFLNIVGCKRYQKRKYTTKLHVKLRKITWIQMQNLRKLQKSDTARL